jgi:hypothetical protein
MLRLWKGVDWTQLDQDCDSLVGVCEHGNECLSSVKYRELLGQAIVTF